MTPAPREEGMEIRDSEVDDFFHLAEHVDVKCPECRCPMMVDPDSGFLVCPKCGFIDEE